MMLKIRFILILLILTGLQLQAQVDSYGYKRELIGVSEQWHRISLPSDIFEKLNSSMSDIRIYGLMTNGDTVEAPYFIRSMEEQVEEKSVSFKILNQSHNSNGYYFTFEIPVLQDINTMNLDFSQPNFDWRVKLEGSHNQQEWFVIADNYRILSIQNNETTFQYTRITFPSSKYQYYRLLVHSAEQPVLLDASIAMHQIISGKYSTYNPKNIEIRQNKKDKKTEVNIDFQSHVPVSYLKIAVNDTYDYYRPVTIWYVADSVKTEQGWKYGYSILASGILNSLGENVFKFSSTTLRQIKVEVGNYDNAPLSIGTVEVKGFDYELVARFTSLAKYWMFYGNRFAPKPNYDILEFHERIPENIAELKLGDEQQILKDSEVGRKVPLFQHKAWLWAIMAVIILVLGWFSVKMIRLRNE